MSKISNLIFNGANHYITSKFGSRSSISTSAGKTSSFHNGTDYGTDGKKIAQYAIEDGYVFAAQKSNSDGALYVWVIYPRIKKAMLHYHLDSYKVKAGQAVKKGTLLGYTGKTGKSTGVHLHLGIREINKLSDAQIKKMTWNALQSCVYIDPEKVAYTAPVQTPQKVAQPTLPKSDTSKTPSKSTVAKPIAKQPEIKDGFLPKRGYFTKGDKSENVGKIATFMRKNFPKYTPEEVLGNYYGDNIIGAVKEFQSRSGLKASGDFNADTLKELKKHGFKE